MPIAMKASRALFALEREEEALRLRAYPDPATGGAPWTIGYGHTHDVHPGMTITEAQAEAFLAADVAEAEAIVNRSVHVPLTQGQFDALVDFVFNIGPGGKWAGDGFTTSTLLARLNAGDYASGPHQLSLWNHAAGRELAGLTKRRAREAALWTGKPYVAPLAVTKARTERETAIIRGVQGQLKALHYPVGKVDGIYGNLTRDAIKAFQADNELTDTGRIDQSLLDTLKTGKPRLLSLERQNASPADLKDRPTVKIAGAVRNTGAAAVGASLAVGAAQAAIAAMPAIASAPVLHTAGEVLLQVWPFLASAVGGALVYALGRQLLGAITTEFRQGQLL
ncbi:Phage-related lysozyme (muramidase), GH24 family [Faunimonas pinastri]|uniref:Lysozyme n=1 Tax=Faunimonas pinastri TaxID=1855383 RepID=A0A1H9I7C8_9HYPH|nr:glycoside hydrolase family protein [Faunimonas pinastri]SEQ70473.1 Phage-related lysozyme (muramidase), GH24 family [Faunimonas pinastri]